MIDFVRLMIKSFGWRLGALAAVALVAFIKHRYL